jgi:predicted amidophosphoribosyltransferase
VRILALLLPERCVICEAPGGDLCTTCRDGLMRLRPPMCERCGAPGPWPVRRCAECAGRRLSFVEARAAIVYDAGARALVGAWKERGRRRLAHTAAELVVEVVRRPAGACLVPVPADPGRALERGDAPARSLAVMLGRSWQLPVVDGLRRMRSLPRQRGLSLEERHRNARGSVVAVVEALPREVCIVDDVYTSGATANACAAAAKRAGTRRVTVVALARAVR